MVRRLGSLLVGLLLLVGLVSVAPWARAVDVEAIHLAWEEPAHDLITDTTYWGSKAWLDLYGPDAVYDVSWTLLDASGTSVLPPVEVGSINLRAGPSYLFVDPEGHGTRIPAGTYALAVTAVDETATRTATMPLTLVDDPPPSPAPPVTSVRASIYWSSGNPVPALWTVPALTTRIGNWARLTVREGRGRVVYDENRNAPGCGMYDYDSCTVGDPRAYRLEWDGFGRCVADGCPMQPAGVYSASAEIPDKYGRPVRIALGSVRLYHDAYATRQVIVMPAQHRVRAGSIAGRCSSIRVPGPRHINGSVGMLSDSRCTSRHRNADLAVQRFRVRLPDVPMSEVVELAAGGRTIPLAASPATGPRHNLYRVRFRVPGVTGWHADRFRAQGAWGEVQWFPALPSHVDLGGRTVEIEVRVAKGNRVDLRRLRIRLSYWHWSLG